MSKPSPSRVSVVEQVWYQSAGEQPHALSLRMYRALNTTAQAYSRRKNVGTKWEELDTGWVNVPSFVIIENNEGQRPASVLSIPEKAALSHKVLWVSLGEINEPAHLVIQPGEHLRLPLNVGTRVYLRAAEGSIKVMIHAIPGDE
jgi:hypothetical protein